MTSCAPGPASIEQRLALSEETLRLATDAADVGVWDLDLISDVLTWCDRTKAMFGISPDAPCSMADFYAGLHAEDSDATSAAFASALDPAVRATYDVEYRTIGKEDGVVRWVAAKGKALFDDSGRCVRALGTAIDITARKTAAVREAFVLGLVDRLARSADPETMIAQAIEALGAHLRADRVGYGHVQEDTVSIVLETCYARGVQPIRGVFTLDSFGRDAIARNRRGETAAVGDVLVEPDHDPEVWAAIDTRAYLSVPLVRDGRFRASVFVNRRRPHAWTDEEVAVVEAVAGRLWDAVERARAEAALRRLNASLEHLVDARTRERDRTWRLSPVVMVVAAQDGLLLEANPAWTATLGWSLEETIGRNVMGFVAPEDHAAGAAGMARLFDGEPVHEYKLRFLTRDGRRRAIAWTTMPEGVRLYGFGRDITEQAFAEEGLRQAQKMEALGQLTGGIAHDFNNLLGGVTGSLELIAARIAQGRIAEAPRFIELGLSASRRAAALTQRLLAFARRQALAPMITDVGALVGDMRDLIARSLGPHLALQVDLEPGLWRTMIDPSQLENALLNLCINARDALPNGGRVIIRAANVRLGETATDGEEGEALPPGDYVCLSVVDDGVGMPPDIAARAFDPFFTTKPLGQGTGLGLSMVFGFMRQSGGEARIESRPGFGTTVRLYLPRRDGDVAAAPATAANDGGRGAGQSVLVIDDEPTMRDLLVEALVERGYDAFEAADGGAGLEWLRSERPIDLLVSDVGLPGGLNGRQVADAGRVLRPGLKVILITGYAGAGLEGAGLGPDMRLLAKPFDLDRFHAAVAEILRPDPAAE
jgi:PAS domain S-box-containing protein